MPQGVEHLQKILHYVVSRAAQTLDTAVNLRNQPLLFRNSAALSNLVNRLKIIIRMIKITAGNKNVSCCIRTYEEYYSPDATSTQSHEIHIERNYWL